MHRVFAAMGRFAVRFRWVIVAAWVAAAVLANLFLPSLSSVAKQSNTDMLPAGSPSLHAAVYTSVLASLAIGILMDALLVRTLLVPSTVALLGRWNWWPSRHGVLAHAIPDVHATRAGVRYGHHS